MDEDEICSGRRHYDMLLAPLAGWLAGDFDAALRRATAEIEDMGMPAGPAHALDLGSGLGLHALAMAQRGMQVTALDGCSLLIAQLQTRAGALPLHAIHADIEEFARHLHAPPALVLCLGDTLALLPAPSHVATVVAQIAAHLTSEGCFAMTFRDAAAPIATGSQVLRRDAARIFTSTALDGGEHLIIEDSVSDLVNGAWHTRRSRYRRLKLPTAWLIAQLEAHGLRVRRETAPAGLTRLIAFKA